MRSFHFCQCLEGALNNWDIKTWRALAKDNAMTVKAIKKEFRRLMAEGKEVIPIGECDNFDFKKGCQGHELEKGEEK